MADDGNELEAGGSMDAEPEEAESDDEDDAILHENDATGSPRENI